VDEPAYQGYLASAFGGVVLSNIAVLVDVGTALYDDVTKGSGHH
jgi:hypothetical protein